MWETSDFTQYLKNEVSSVAADPFRDVLMPQIEQGVIDSILAAKEVLQHRDRSHELFGYDFMVDENLNVWLLEINASPSMEFSTKITEKLVKQSMPQICSIILDHNHGSTEGKEVGCLLEDFKLIYKQ